MAKFSHQSVAVLLAMVVFCVSMMAAPSSAQGPAESWPAPAPYMRGSPSSAPGYAPEFSPSYAPAWAPEYAPAWAPEYAPIGAPEGSPISAPVVASPAYSPSSGPSSFESPAYAPGPMSGI
ncbi:hypothetical protein M758_1G173100 [Ceratodon purpureus]|nr:hypothetical protein M758_1G173100 [Ceratodon purpureus]